MDLIRRTFRAIWEARDPTTIDQVIEFTDVCRALRKLPVQYQQALQAWHEYDGDPVGIAMEMGRSLEDAKVTIRSAWDYLYDLLNGEP